MAVAVALILVAQAVGSWTAPVANAADPSPDLSPAPLESPVPSDAGSPIPTLDPSQTINPTPTDTIPPDPTADPGLTPVPTTAPDATIVPSPDPAPDPGPPDSTPGSSASPGPSPNASPPPTPIPWTLSNGQQTGGKTAAPIPLYRLSAARTVTTAAPTAVHTIVGITSPECAACHSGHTAQSPDLVVAPPPDSTLCFECHSGTGSPYDVAAQFSGAPANDPTTDSYYRHLIEGDSGRSATCADCHNPHDANSTRPVMTTAGWTASGDIRAANGVAVTNGAIGTAPRYTPISRSNGASLTFEYQLCFACHSGVATLTSPNASHPSWWALDKGIELNPASAAYHPIEAAGKNQSTQMAASLAGTSPFKAWNYTTESTIRCASCHGDPSTVNQTATGTPLTPTADAQEATHAGDNRGLLIAPYRDRVLKSAGEAYSSNDFALCYLCHAEAPFVDPNENPNAPDTQFSLHGFHLTDIAGTPDLGTSIDHAGDGPGLAICAECHFRIHSTALAYQVGDTAPVARSTGNPGLVDFAPDVKGLGTNPPIWNPPNSLGTGSCALTCHGFTHLASATTYQVAPGTDFTADRTSGSAGTGGLVVQFTDETTYATTATAAWAWSFGDGGMSTAQSPSHTYTSAGAYTVTLTVTRTTGPGVNEAATMTRSGYITVTP